MEPSATILLHAWRGGEATALDRLLSLVYDELARIARGALRSERADHTLQTRALVHEAYLRLIDADVSWQDKAHFMAVAARTMRRVLVDNHHAVRRLRDDVGLMHLRPRHAQRRRFGRHLRRRLDARTWGAIKRLE